MRSWIERKRGINNKPMKINRYTIHLGFLNTSFKPTFYLPKRPSGLTTKIMPAIKNNKGNSISGNMAIPKDLVKPTRRDPTKAPLRLPRPPTTTTIKARMSGSIPMPNKAGVVGTTKAPASPAKPDPRTKANVLSFPISSPNPVAISLSKEMALSIIPNFVLPIKNQMNNPARQVINITNKKYIG
jgi:hypothetical protein